MIQGMLRRGQILIARNMQAAAAIEEPLGEGAQAEVYRARVGNSHYALKWYRPEYLATDQRLWERLRTAIRSGSPTEQFLWPFDLVSYPQVGDFGGYLMPLKSPEFVSLVELIRRQSEPTFRVLAVLGFRLAHSFLQLHAAGLCYRDINFGNIFFNPETGDIRIADTDNVDVNLRAGSIKGTPGFMAPEVARDLVQPNAMTDRFSLAVLLFHIFFIGHPLKGRRELELNYDPDDPDQSRRLCALDPIFIFDPNNPSNRPAPGVHDGPIGFWPIYPESLRRLFIRAFTDGLQDPEARVMENEWRKEMCDLSDSIFPCPCCEAENFFDLELVRQKRNLNPCWCCAAPLRNPPRMRIGRDYGARLVMLSPGAQLFPHHLHGDTYNFSKPLAQVAANPLALQNLSAEIWTCRRMDGSMMEIGPGQMFTIERDCHISLGRTEAEVRLS